ncbi:haloacid dehalogenase superfamily, subfamily IA, variant 3 with third motif having DD or ED/haloacid dehalogenase superfamily, subfamily IA, variant 1 with third motif having Dx(3-4)D or Dx(3-4)E [Kushneria avicenniae]|uniref:Haloacid dehalogenase superfamily, subfamily IA, variant 3 with third motif having DD or ED/haloacid dehalogenase superfamily, subfamily IA, variant 1 with third motif having Dx(3-4)D or Dx(3-4)E n=1 Tax=Kushneria avicenniae TaxID=402385 RepID=A0A1I1IC06_9GAMM|nr:HAD family hydrolase [Kushneria avicenniae]SFC33919.1 haloacid dehalogenase superfamily, subfamily IA, variant 3 with third motif having DD or ED/haloacid dehalogenase superfamily, subfamily IA, variant 1 with third motif having Dx(3-4)D or Dx(3-4)E [Kushneria avicenniae]
MTIASLNDCRHWVFDMDGTLTVGVHDFRFIRRQLEVPDDSDILEYLESLPEAQRRACHEWLMAHERELAARSTPAEGAVALIRELCERGDRLGILTRNARELAHITLEVIGLAACFDHADVLGREDAAPKPHPEGLEHFIQRWGVSPSHIVMVGDSPLDMQCGRAAGTRTVLVNVPDNPCPEQTDHHLEDCHALKAALFSP